MNFLFSWIWEINFKISLQKDMIFFLFHLYFLLINHFHFICCKKAFFLEHSNSNGEVFCLFSSSLSQHIFPFELFPFHLESLILNISNSNFKNLIIYIILRSIKPFFWVYSIILFPIWIKKKANPYLNFLNEKEIFFENRFVIRLKFNSFVWKKVVF